MPGQRRTLCAIGEKLPCSMMWYHPFGLEASHIVLVEDHLEAPLKARMSVGNDKGGADICLQGEP